MEGLRQYILSVVAAALVCSLVSCVMPQGKARQLLRLLCGAVLTTVVLGPLMGIDNISLSDFLEQWEVDAAYYTAQGEQMTQDALAESIKGQTEAYILDKADALGAAIQAEVTLNQSDPPVPVSVTLTGEASPYVRSRLEAILESDLGIAKENLKWTG